MIIQMKLIAGSRRNDMLSFIFYVAIPLNGNSSGSETAQIPRSYKKYVFSLELFRKLAFLEAFLKQRELFDMS